MDQILQDFNEILPLSDELELLLRKTVQRTAIRKRTKLLRAGRPCSRLYFIEKGLLRIYVKHKDKEYNSWLLQEGDMATSVTGFFEKVISPETIEALEDSIVWSLTREELENIYTMYPEFRKIGLHYIGKYYCRDDRMKINLLSRSPAEFFDYLVTTSPSVVNRVPIKHLASYMGITVQTFLRIVRNRLRQENDPAQEDPAKKDRAADDHLQPP